MKFKKNPGTEFSVPGFIWFAQSAAIIFYLKAAWPVISIPVISRWMS